MTAVALAMVISMSTFPAVFAASSTNRSIVRDHKFYTVTKSEEGISFEVDYQATGEVTVSTSSNYFTFTALTSIHANETTNGCWIPPRNFIIYVGWQVADYYTGDTYKGYGDEKDIKCPHGDAIDCNCRTSATSGTRSVPRNSSIRRITVFGAHTAYKNGTTIMQKYTTTASPAN